MKATYLVLGLLLAATACKDSSKPAEEVEKTEDKPAMTSEEYINAYIDTINVVSDSLSSAFSRILEDAGRNLDSTKMAMEARIPAIQQMNGRLNQLNHDVNDLMEKKWISQEDYQMMMQEIDMNGLSKRIESLRAVGIDMTDHLKDTVHQ